jgi:capsular exopolysaccharide synthesis family protein
VNHPKHIRRTPIFSYYDTESPESLEFHRLYSRLRQVNLGQEKQYLAITSATMSEGKSTTAALLATTIAKYQESNVLLVDFDLRNPKIHQIFDLDRKDGVAEIIEHKRSAKVCFKETLIPNLKILTSGYLSISYTDAFQELRLKRFFDEIKFYYDTIIIDTAPVIPVSDALLIGPETNGVMFVIRAGKTPRDIIKKACTLMTDSGMNILGIVMNDMEKVMPQYYKYEYYGYYSGNGGKKKK